MSLRLFVKHCNRHAKRMVPLESTTYIGLGARHGDRLLAFAYTFPDLLVQAFENIAIWPVGDGEQLRASLPGPSDDAAGEEQVCEVCMPHEACCNAAGVSLHSLVSFRTNLHAPAAILRRGNTY